MTAEEKPYISPEAVRVEKVSNPGKPEVFVLRIEEVWFWNSKFLLENFKQAVDSTGTGLIYPKPQEEGKSEGPFLVFGDSKKTLCCFLCILDYCLRHSCPHPRPPCVWTL